MIKDIANSSGRPLLDKLFNFMVGMTKETHLCHCVVLTSDCIFINEVYGNARLEGRADYIIIDDLDKERTFRVYDDFGFHNKELVWRYGIW